MEYISWYYSTILNYFAQTMHPWCGQMVSCLNAKPSLTMIPTEFDQPKSPSSLPLSGLSSRLYSIFNYSSLTSSVCTSVFDPYLVCLTVFLSSRRAVNFESQYHQYHPPPPPAAISVISTPSRVP